MIKNRSHSEGVDFLFIIPSLNYHIAKLLRRFSDSNRLEERDNFHTRLNELLLQSHQAAKSNKTLDHRWKSNIYLLKV